MKENYTSIPYRIVRGMYGYLGGLLLDAVHGTIAPVTEFVTPPNPGPLLFPTGSTNINSVNLNRDHEEACREHKEWVNLDRAKKNHRISY